ncbi:MAG: hypothetical protein LBB61_01445 [Treponema sp.]|jgi:hypothetical protein|nr:hypothetical protein [Treponema sp.]
METTKTMKNKLLGHLPFLVMLMLAFASCSGQIRGVLREDGSADITIQSALLPSVTALIGAVSMNTRSGSILDAQTIVQSLRRARGVESAAMRNITPSSVDGSVNISQINDFLDAPGAQIQRFITYKQINGSGRLSITLDRAIAPQLVKLLSPDIADYLSCLMAPGPSTDWQYIQTKTEYLRQLRATYNMLQSNRGLGNALAAELETAAIRLTLDVPGVISSVQGGTFSGANAKRAEFTIPVIDLLVLEKPLVYEIVWK